MRKKSYLNKTFSNIVEFENLKVHLETNDFREYVSWFNRLMKLSPRTLWAWLKTNPLSKEKTEYAELAYKMTL